MAAATSESSITLEFYGALADRFASVGRRRGTRVHVEVSVCQGESVRGVLDRLIGHDRLYAQLYDSAERRFPEHVEVVLNNRVIELQGGLEAKLHPGDVLGFLPAHAGG